jgi:hypothetical protein
MEYKPYRPHGSSERVPDPSLDEIKQRCEEIRQGWSELEHRNRASMTQFLWRPPVVSLDDAQSLLGCEQ